MRKRPEGEQVGPGVKDGVKLRQNSAKCKTNVYHVQK